MNEWANDEWPIGQIVIRANLSTAANGSFAGPFFGEDRARNRSGIAIGI